MGKDDTLVLFNEVLEERTNKAGKKRYTIRVKAEPVIINADPRALGKPIADAIAHHYKERIKGITALAAPATIKARQVALKAFMLGKPWAMKRYSGGRTGSKPPLRSERAFNDSGRFGDSISVNASSDGHWRINVASNRLDQQDGAAQRIFKRLAELVPEIADPSLLLNNQILKRALIKANEGLIIKARETTKKLSWDIVRATLDLASKVANL